MALPCYNLNLNLYRVFYTVAKTKSFSESSRALHISQPAISKHIQNLEYELNTLLFYRNNRGIELTPEAKVLLTYVEKAWNFLMLGEKQLQESKELMKGKISIGVPTFISIYYLNDYIKGFMEKHPNIVIKMANGSSESLLPLLYQHTLDLLVVPGNIPVSKDFKVIPLEKGKYCFAYNKEKLGDLDVTRVEELADKQVLLPVKTTSSRKKLEEYLAAKGVCIDPIMELESNEMMMHYTLEGMGIGYLLYEVAKQDEKLTIVELEEELPYEMINLIYNDSTLTSSSKEFVSMLTNDNGF